MARATAVAVLHWDPADPPSTDPPSTVTVGTSSYTDNTQRLQITQFENDVHGDTLPPFPCVLQGVCDAWECFGAGVAADADPAAAAARASGGGGGRSGGEAWTVASLTKIIKAEQPLSLDGGPLLSSPYNDATSYLSFCPPLCLHGSAKIADEHAMVGGVTRAAMVGDVESLQRSGVCTCLNVWCISFHLGIPPVRVWSLHHTL